MNGEGRKKEEGGVDDKDSSRKMQLKCFDQKSRRTDHPVGSGIGARSHCRDRGEGDDS